MSYNKTEKRYSRLIEFMDDTYLERSSRPISALVFLIPLIALYEIGTILVNTSIDESQIRVVSFIWIQNALSLLGLSQKAAWFCAPLVIVVILLAMQITSKKRWRVKVSDYFIMIGECIALSVPLIVLSLMLNNPPTSPLAAAKYPLQLNTTVSQTMVENEIEPISISTSGQEPTQSVLGIIVTGIGAGIYEELIFRLILICILMIILQDMFVIERPHAIILAVLISALIFSLHHHIIYINGNFTRGEAFVLPSFIFRTFAGIYFAVLYATRGFGIAAGCHAFYDIIIAIMNAIAFEQI